jgi:esterase/lipase
MSEYTCKYCKNTFTRRTILLKHQRTAQYCLKLQNRETILPKCKYCDKELSRKDNLARHERSCALEHETRRKKAVPTNMQEKQTGQLLEMIIQLQKTIANMSERPAGTTNNVSNTRNMTMNLAPITDEEIQEHLEHLTIDFIQEGAKGYASYANSYPFKDRVVCTDKARKKLRYKDGEGVVVDDGGGHKLATRFFQAIAPKNEEIINAEYRALHEEVEQIAKDGTAYRADLTGLLTKASHLQELLIKCQEAARGEENELTKEFVNHLSKML